MVRAALGAWDAQNGGGSGLRERYRGRCALGLCGFEQRRLPEAEHAGHLDGREDLAPNIVVGLTRFGGRFVSLQSTSWSWRPACRLRRLSVSGIPGPNATAPDYTNPRYS